ncbi:Phospholipase D alpha 2 [Portunus trituberculatus]|uniref:Phospholipase D alpha 2 n=2 Tax=Portunus trituberculatus TaxID=210409 RepID=A0A5B7DZE7_PORTR|nr:Phospholipase D alpha 2 [Portunus trituberculatus]
MFRKRLWAEHTCGLSEKEKPLQDPSSLNAIRRIKELAHESWKCFLDGKPDEETKNHFLTYPLQVTEDGQVQPQRAMPNIPDFDLPVQGSKWSLPIVPVL